MTSDTTSEAGEQLFADVLAAWHTEPTRTAWEVVPTAAPSRMASSFDVLSPSDHPDSKWPVCSACSSAMVRVARLCISDVPGSFVGADPEILVFRCIHRDCLDYVERRLGEGFAALHWSSCSEPEQTRPKSYYGKYDDPRAVFHVATSEGTSDKNALARTPGVKTQIRAITDYIHPHDWSWNTVPARETASLRYLIAIEDRLLRYELVHALCAQRASRSPSGAPASVEGF